MMDDKKKKDLIDDRTVAETDISDAVDADEMLDAAETIDAGDTLDAAELMGADDTADAAEVLDADDPVIAAEAMDTADADGVIREETIQAAPPAAEPNKPGRFRSSFKNRKLAVGIGVLAVLLVANVAVFGMNKHSMKCYRDHGGRAVAEREYKQGSICMMQDSKCDIKEKGCCKDGECVDMSQKDKCTNFKGKGKEKFK